MRSATIRAAAMTAGVAMAVALTACTTEPPQAAVTTLKANNYDVPVDWNPSNSFVYSLPQQAVYESLIYLDSATFEWKPLLAEEFEISEDLRSMRIKLREDVDFTDGAHLDAEGAKVALDYAFSTGWHVVLKQQFDPQVEVTGEYEIEVTAKGAMTSDFLFWFGIVSIASPQAITENPEGLTDTPVGSGPYVIDEVVPEVSISFVRNPEYRNPDAYPFDELEFYVMEDSIAVGNALRSGQLNVGSVDSAHAADLEDAGFALHLDTAGQAYLLWQDPTGRSVPALADKRVRQAIAYALDREAIIENIEYGFGTVTSQMWGKGSPYYIEGADDTYAYDPDKSRELLAEAGYEDGFDLVIPTTGAYAKYQPVVQQALADIGIRVTYEDFVDFGDFVRAANSGDYGLVIRDTSDLFFNAVLRIDIADGGFPQLNEQYEIIDNGTREESQAAQRKVAEIMLDEVIGIALSRPASVWASIPEITVEGSVVAAAKPLVAIQLAD